VTDAIISPISPGKKPGNQLAPGSHSILRDRFEQALKIEHRRLGKKIKGPRSPMFEFVRAIKNCEGLWDLDEQEAGDIINQFMENRHPDSLDPWKAEFPQHEYPLDAFLDNWTEVEFPSGKLERAAVAAESKNIQPPGRSTKEYCRFLSLSSALQELSGDSAFFLSIRKTAEALHVSKSAVAVYIRLAIKAGFLHRTKAAVFDPSNKQESRAAEYRFVDITETPTDSHALTSGHKVHKGTQGPQGLQGSQGTQELAILSNRTDTEQTVQPQKEGREEEEQEMEKESCTEHHQLTDENALTEEDSSTTKRLFGIWQSLATPRGSSKELLTFETKSRLCAFEKAIGPIDAPFVLQCAVSHWDEFRDMAAHRGDITPTPSTRSLVEHWRAANLLYMDHLPGLSAGSSPGQEKTRGDIIAAVERLPWDNFAPLREAVKQGTMQALAEQVSHLPKKLQWDGIWFRLANEDGTAD
jgi:hypothetical protein